MAEHKLTMKQRTFVVIAFATFESATDIQKQLKDDFGVELSLPAVTHYNPEANAHLGDKWKTLFTETRKRFTEDVSGIAIANKAFRLRELDRHYRRQTKGVRVNPVELRATLEQAAKESGDGYSNRRELTAAGGKPLIPDNGTVVLYLPDNGRGDADKTPANNAEPGVTADNGS